MEEYYTEMPKEVEELADRVLHGRAQILTLKEYPILNHLTPFEEYRGTKWGAKRKRVDELDQVTFWPR